MREDGRQGSGPAGQGQRPRKRPKKATPEYLQRAALFYLERYATSAENLRRVLLRKVTRSARFHDTDPEEGARAIEALIERFTRSGLLNDMDYAAMRARTLFRRGQSQRAIRQGLVQKGLGEAEIEAALTALKEDVGNPELAAALAYARRRRLGPYRAAPGRGPGEQWQDGQQQDKQRQKDLAALARRGFSSELALRVLDAEDPVELEDEAAEPAR